MIVVVVVVFLVGGVFVVLLMIIGKMVDVESCEGIGVVRYENLEVVLRILPIKFADGDLLNPPPGKYVIT